MSLLEVENVRYSSRAQEIIKGISLKIDAGETVAIMGKSGSGKSSLLKLIAGILVPASGRALFNGTDINLMNVAQNKAFRKKCAFMFQDAALWANQDILSNLSLPLQIHFPEMKAKDRLLEITNICKMVGYERALSLRPADLSMGEQKQVAFARAMICKPDVLFLDECTESLDKKGVQTILELLHDFEDSGRTMIYVTHSAAFEWEFSGRRIVLEDGMLSHDTGKLNGRTVNEV